ncbi:MAG TPA: trehalose utilization protein ThuA, partial [Thermoprotei archaeon]|nr:trehalose utilization protein ThuA [Thermoprotei archaeon]
MNKIKVTVWNEYISEKDIPDSKKIYPKGMHKVIADFLIEEGFIVR